MKLIEGDAATMHSRDLLMEEMRDLLRLKLELREGGGETFADEIALASIDAREMQLLGELTRMDEFAGQPAMDAGPTLFKDGGYRFFFFSREEARPHVHVDSSDGEAKFWIIPAISLAYNKGLTAKQLRALQKIIEAKRDEIQQAWQEHFGG